jgi:hypothetical protein
MPIAVASTTGAIAIAISPAIVKTMQRSPSFARRSASFCLAC